MKKRVAIAAICAGFSLTGGAQTTGGGPAGTAVAQVQQMEAAGRPAAEIVSMLVEADRTVTAATAVAVAAATTEVLRRHATLFGMCLAPERRESATDVGAAALVAAGHDDQVVAAAVATFTTDQCGFFYTRLRPPGTLGVEPSGPALVLPPPVSPSN
jgi:hypothetical protein